MAATQKTLTPTNEVISIPAFADKPDYRLPIDSTGKLADAINVLNGKMANNESETICGKWGDSTLYRRVINATLSSWTINTSVTLATIATGLNIRKIEAVIYVDSAHAYRTTSDKFNVEYISTDGKVNAYQNYTSYGVAVYVVLEYTI